MVGPLTVAKRLALGFGLILFLMVAVSLIGNQRVGFIDRTLTTVEDGAAVKQRHAINFRGSVHDRAIAIRDAVLVDSDRARARHMDDIDQLESFYRDNAQAMDRLFSEGEPSKTERQLLAAIKDIERRTLGLTEDLLALPPIPHGFNEHHKDFPGVIWVEPEKTFAQHVPLLVNLMGDQGPDLIIPRRASLRSYPDYQMAKELEGNHEAGTLTGRPDLDLWFGPRVMNRRMAELFVEYDE